MITKAKSVVFRAILLTTWFALVFGVLSVVWHYHPTGQQKHELAHTVLIDGLDMPVEHELRYRTVCEKIAEYLSSKAEGDDKVVFLDEDAERGSMDLKLEGIYSLLVRLYTMSESNGHRSTENAHPPGSCNGSIAYNTLRMFGFTLIERTNCSRGNLCRTDECIVVDDEYASCRLTPKCPENENGNMCRPGTCDPLTGDCLFSDIDCDDKDLGTHDDCDPSRGCSHRYIGDDCNPSRGDCIYHDT